LNFTGSGFLFVRNYDSRQDAYPFEIGVHRHEWHEFVWARCPGPAAAESDEFTLDGTRYPFGDANLIYIPPFHAHKFRVTGPLRNWIIGVDEGQMRKVFAHSPISRPLEGVFASWTLIPPRMAFEEGEDRSRLAAFVESLTAGTYSSGTMAPLDALHFLVSLAPVLGPWKNSSGAGAKKPEAADSKGDRIAFDAMEYLELNFSRKVGVDECASRIGVSRSTLSHRFRAVTGQSLPQWLAEIRLRHARALLVETDLDIIDVALECGFNDNAWFSRHFRASTGMSPSEWRNRSRSLHESPNSAHDPQRRPARG
jgi:AraC-like DNA-binding protein